MLKELHRVALEANRRGVAIPSADLDVVSERTCGRAAAEQAVKRLVHSGRAVRVRRNLLVLPETTGLLGVELVDLVDAIAPRPYLITGGAALQYFDLTDQHYFGVIVLIPREVTKLTWRGQTATFFTTDPTNIWGWDPATKPHYALPERALVDVLNHPRYGVSFAQALSALVRAESRDDAFLDRLLTSVRRYGAGPRGHGSRASARRVGFVVQHLFGTDVAAPYRELVGPNPTPVLLRPGGSSSGPIDSTWRVVVNAVVEPESTS